MKWDFDCCDGGCGEVVDVAAGETTCVDCKEDDNAN